MEQIDNILVDIFEDIDKDIQLQKNIGPLIHPSNLTMIKPFSMSTKKDRCNG